MRYLKWAGIVFAVLFVIGTIMNIVDPDYAKRAAEERAAISTSGKKETPPGFTSGFLAGSVCKTQGMVKPSSDVVDAMARKAALENNIEPGKRSHFVGNYTQAFWMGWNRAR